MRRLSGNSHFRRQVIRLAFRCDNTHPALLLGFVVLLSHRRHLTLPALLGGCIGIWLAVGAAGWPCFLPSTRQIRNVRHVWEVGAHNIRVGWSVLLAACLRLWSFRWTELRSAQALAYATLPSMVSRQMRWLLSTRSFSRSHALFSLICRTSHPRVPKPCLLVGRGVLGRTVAISLAGYFPLRWLIMRLLPDYLSSLPVASPADAYDWHDSCHLYPAHQLFS